MLKRAADRTAAAASPFPAQYRERNSPLSRLPPRGENSEARMVSDPTRPRDVGAHHPDEPVVLPPREARQGTRGGPVRNVLIGGIALVVVAFVIIYLAFAR
jgi:hypothetical protein